MNTRPFKKASPKCSAKAAILSLVISCKIQGSVQVFVKLKDVFKQHVNLMI